MSEQPSNLSQTDIKNLQKLLLDENDEIASLAILKIRSSLTTKEQDKLITSLQESSETFPRKRGHQLSVVRQLENRLTDLQFEASRPSFCLWHKLWELHDLHQYSFTAQKSIGQFLKQIITELRGNAKTLPEVAAYFQSHNFYATNRADNLDSSNFSINTLINEFSGNDIMFCALIQFIMLELELGMTQFAIFKGIFGLVDDHGNWLSPSEGWQITKAINTNSLKICSPYEFYKLYLSLRITALLTEGNLKEFSFFCKHFTEIKKQSWQETVIALQKNAQEQLPSVPPKSN